jgi:hypothetical protein
VLEAVRIEVARVERRVRLHVVVELDDLHVQALLLLRDLLHDLPHLRIRAGDRADLDHLVFGVGARRQRQRGTGGHHGKYLQETATLHLFLTSLLTEIGARYGYPRTRRKGQMVSQDRAEVKYIPLIYV